MPTEKDPTQELQAQVLDGIRKSQEAVIDGMRTWAETIQQLVPGTAQAALPGTDQLPTPAEVVDSVFDSAAQLLNAQRELAHSVLGVTTAIGRAGPGGDREGCRYGQEVDQALTSPHAGP